MNRFPRVMAVRLGYDPEQVDELVDRIERTLGLRALDGPPVTAEEIRNAKFGVKLGGYNETAVDFALDAFIVAVEARAGQAGPALTAAQAGPAPPTGRQGGSPAAGQSAHEVSEARPARTSGAAAPRTQVSAAEVSETPASRVPASASSAAREATAAAVSAPVTSRSAASTADTDRPAPGPDEDAVPVNRTARPESANTAVSEETSDCPDARTWRETQAARVERVAFRPGRLGMGYREEEVDAFLDRVVATLRGTADEPLTAEQVRTATFATVVFRPGYAIREVDGFLAEMASVLERRP